MNKLNKLLFFFFPFRDSVGIALSSFPMRLGELFSCIYFIGCWTRNKTKKFKRIDSRLKIVLIALLSNLLLTALVSLANSDVIDQPFCQKYLLRNLLNIFLIASIYKTTISYNDDLIIKGMKWNIVLQVFAAILFFGLSRRIYMNGLTSIWDIQTASYGNIEIPRFSGTSSEAGYLGPLLAMPLFYFWVKRREHKLLCAITVSLLAVSVSSFNFVVIIMALGYNLFLHNKRKFFRSFSIGVIALILTTAIFSFFFQNTLVGTIIDQNVQKIIGYASLANAGQQDWSAMDRTEHLNNAITLFFNGDFSQMLIGRGTGAYSFYAMHFSDVTVDNVQEAYNIYLSTLTDRGIIGLILFVIIFYNIYKIKTNNIISNTIWFALFVQLVHYFIVGNMWLYYVWQEIIFLIGYERYLLIKKNNKYETQIN